METTWNVLKQACPTRQVLDRVADKWTMLVITTLDEAGVQRFSELRRRIEGISQKMLTQTLRALEREGLVTRTVTPTVPVTVEYELTELGLSLGEAVATIRSWAYSNIDSIIAAREQYDSVPRPSLVTLNSSGGQPPLGLE